MAKYGRRKRNDNTPIHPLHAKFGRYRHSKRGINHEDVSVALLHLSSGCYESVFDIYIACISHTKNKNCEIIEDSQDEKNRLSTSAAHMTPFFGIFGQINLVTGAYLILIEQASLIGELLQSGSEILRIEKLLYIPLTNTQYPIQM